MPRGTVRTFVPPAQKGWRTSLPAHLLSDDYVQAGLNFMARDGAWIVRPGFTTVSSSAPFTNAVMGGVSFFDNSISGTAPIQRTFAASLTKISEWDGTTWTDRTGTALTGSAADPVRMAVYQNATSTIVLVTNNTDPPRQVSHGSNSTNLTGGAPTTARDATVVFQRGVLGNITLGGVRAPSTIAISDKDNMNSWSTVNQVTLSDTPDTIVGVRAINNTTFAIYKDLSIWVGVGAPDVFPFRYELRAVNVPGPCSPAAIVSAQGIHFYMGQDGSFYRFDGSVVQEIGHEISAGIISDWNPTTMSRNFGFYDRQYDQVWWFYCQSGQQTPNSAVVYDIRQGAWSVICRFGISITGGFEWVSTTGVAWSDLSSYTWVTVATPYPRWDSFTVASQLLMMIGDSTGIAYTFGGAVGTDNGSTISANFTTPLRDLTGAGEIIWIDAIESFWKQAGASRNVDVTLNTTNTLATAGTAQTAQSFDFSVDTPHKATYGSGNGGDITARYASVKYNVSAANGLDEYRGMVWYVYDRKAS